jgi:hypothetical protein
MIKSISICQYNVNTTTKPNLSISIITNRTIKDIFDFFNKPSSKSIYTNEITNTVNFDMISFSLNSDNNLHEDDEDEDEDDDDEEDNRIPGYSILNTTTKNISTLFLKKKTEGAADEHELLTKFKELVTLPNPDIPYYICIYDVKLDNDNNIVDEQTSLPMIYNYNENTAINPAEIAQYKPSNSISEKYNIELIVNDINTLIKGYNKNFSNEYRYTQLFGEDNHTTLKQIPIDIYTNYIFSIYKKHPRIKLIHAIGLPIYNEKLPTNVNKIIDCEPSNVISSFDFKKPPNIDKLLMNMNVCINNITNLNNAIKDIPGEDDIYRKVEYINYFKNLEKKINRAIITYVKINNTSETQKYNTQRFNMLLHADRNRMIIKYNEDNINYYTDERLKNNVTQFDFSNVPYYYLLGDFTKIFMPTETNAKIVEQMKHILELLTQDKPPPIFIIGYGSSGAGKTSNLIYYKNKDDQSKNEDGILPILCKKIIQQHKKIIRNFGVTITLKTKELYGIKEDNSAIYKIEEFTSNIYKFEYDSVSSDIILKDDTDTNIQHFYRFDYNENNDFLKDDMFKQTTQSNNNNNNANDGYITKIINKGTPLGKVIQFLVDTDRIVKATTNNRQSSRSHVLVFVDITINTKKIHLIVGDFAGIENEFMCDDATLTGMDKQVNTNKKDSNYNSKTFYMHEPILEMNSSNIDMIGGELIEADAFDDSNTNIEEYMEELNETIKNTFADADFNLIKAKIKVYIDTYNGKEYLSKEQTIDFLKKNKSYNTVIKKIENALKINIEEIDKLQLKINSFGTNDISKRLKQIDGDIKTILEKFDVNKDNLKDKNFKMETAGIIIPPSTTSRFSYTIGNPDGWNTICDKLIKKIITYLFDIDTIFKSNKPITKITELDIDKIIDKSSKKNENEISSLYFKYDEKMKKFVNIYSKDEAFFSFYYIKPISVVNSDNTPVDINVYKIDIIDSTMKLIFSNINWFRDRIKESGGQLNIDVFEDEDKIKKLKETNATFMRDKIKELKNNISTDYGTAIYMVHNEIIQKYIYLAFLKKHILTKSCNNRRKEGYWINSSLKDMRLAIQYIVQSKNFNVFYNYIDTCIKDPNYNPDDIPILDIETFTNTLQKNIFIKKIFEHLTEIDNENYKTILNMAKKMVISVYCVFNYTAALNDPPTSPYYNINDLNKIKNNDDINNDTLTEVLTKLKGIPFFSGIDVYKNIDKLSGDCFHALSINDEKIDLSKLIDTFLKNTFKNENKFDIIKLIRNYINNINATSSMGSLEFIDQIAKLNTTQYLCITDAKTNIKDYNIDVSIKKNN